MSLATKTTIQPNYQPAPPISINPERLSGQAVIGLSRVPVAALLDHLDVATFLRDFPSVSQTQVESAIEYLKELAEDGKLGERVDD
ncbi:MAG: DUF433 domain-containing protein [Acidobacteria bacterium]|nr:DUF433 domain-containing protein [Acidobacteriota bacterium]MBI3423157.1 DUF433 domain-containing protein [Acidobacteriota bacterium]